MSGEDEGQKGAWHFCAPAIAPALAAWNFHLRGSVDPQTEGVIHPESLSSFIHR